MYLSFREKAIVYGIILGDGYLQATGEKNARLRLEHGIKQKDYLIWKVKQLPSLFLGRPKFLKRVHPITKMTYSYVRHQSNSTPFLGKLRKVFYPDGVKIIPPNLKKFLNHPLVLAVWYMDDGYYSRKPDDRTSYLYLGKVSRQEAETAKTALKDRFALETSVVDKKDKGMALRFFAKDSKRLGEIIGKYILPLFSYKLFDPVTTCS